MDCQREVSGGRLTGELRLEVFDMRFGDFIAFCLVSGVIVGLLFKIVDKLNIIIELLKAQ